MQQVDERRRAVAIEIKELGRQLSQNPDPRKVLEIATKLSDAARRLEQQ